VIHRPDIITNLRQITELRASAHFIGQCR
jgi:hypothetical protein